MLFIAALFTPAVFAAGHRLGNFGTVYRIAEPDALAELEHRAKSVDWDRVFDKEKWRKKILGYRPRNIKKLPAALKDRVRNVDVSYTLPYDIPDGKGGILYPRGYTFNPLEYIFFPDILVVIDESDSNQVKWLKDSGLLGDIRTMLLLSDGSYYGLAKELGRPVYYLDQETASRLQIEAAPCVIVQKGLFMEVSEYAVR